MTQPPDNHPKPFSVIEGGKTERVPGNEGGPAFGAGIKAEEARGERKALTPEEIEEMHDKPGHPRE